MKQTATIQGRVRAVIYQSPGNPFRIVSIENAQGRHTIKGREALEGLLVGEEARFTGRITKDQKFGEQLDVADVQRIVPISPDALVRWLAHVGLKDMGDMTARRLVEALGAGAVDAVLNRHPKAVTILGGRIDAAIASLLPHRAEEMFGPMLAKHDVGPDVRKEVYAVYGMRTAAVIADDPYRLVADIEGIPLTTADAMAKASGRSGVPETRVRAAIVDAVRQGTLDGHTAIDFATIALYVTERTQIASRFVTKAPETFDHPAVETAEVAGRPALALTRLAHAERTIAEKVLDKLDEETGIEYAEAVDAVARAEALLGVTLNAEQRLSAVHALVCPISIMTGGPGTGKTTTLRVIVAAWQVITAAKPTLRDRAGITLGSPTGKATKRMAEVTDVSAQTFHRMLEIDGSTGRFKRDERTPLTPGLLAFDEVSMADVLIFAGVARAWAGSNVLLVGDPDQLESVGAGRVFADLIACGEIPTTHLIEVRRQAKGSAIALGAAAVRQGKAPATTIFGESDLVFIEQEDPERIAEHVTRLCRTLPGDVQVLTPGHKSPIGTIELNRRLQASAGTTGPEIRISRGATARRGDKVIQKDNDYDRDVYNGDTGTVSEVSEGGAGAVVVMGSDVKTYVQDQLSQLDLAYALTIHKSQGSEYDTVIIPLHMLHFGLLKRTILYTAMTRAKTRCIIIGSRRAFARALANDKSSRRQTTLVGTIAAMAG